MTAPSMTPEQIEELWCLQQSNDATGRPAAIHISHWFGGMRYDSICDA